VLRSHGHYDVRSGETKSLEQRISETEKQLSIAASLCFDKRVPDNILEQNWALVLDLVKQYRHPISL
jgi:hypothetical protein